MSTLPLSTVVQAGRTYYRITSTSHLTPNPNDYFRIVNGEGALRNDVGARYNHPGVVTVYLAEALITCFAERMFYFHRETVRKLDAHHILGRYPKYRKTFTLWEITFKQDLGDVFDLKTGPNHRMHDIFPCLITSPTQDYEHLKRKRAAIQAGGYQGLYAPSSRCTNQGSIVVLFKDQSQNVEQPKPYSVEFRLIRPDGKEFSNHGADELSFASGQVRVVNAPAAPSPLAAFSSWTEIAFHH